MGEFVILIGLPGVGKSTWINKMRQKGLKFVVASTDDIIEHEAKLRGKTYSEYFQTGIKDAERQFYELINRSLSRGENIVIDRTNLTKMSRKRLLSMVPQDYTTTAVFFHTPSRGEHQRRLDSRPGKIIPKEVLDRMSHSIEPPQYYEGFDFIEEV